jgi:hypothetical protein
MDISQMLAGLRTELQHLNAAISVLERIGAGSGKRRGRPPLWMKALSEPKKRGRPMGSKNRPKSMGPKAG